MPFAAILTSVFPFTLCNVSRHFTLVLVFGNTKVHLCEQLKFYSTLDTSVYYEVTVQTHLLTATSPS